VLLKIKIYCYFNFIIVNDLNYSLVNSGNELPEILGFLMLKYAINIALKKLNINRRKKQVRITTASEIRFAAWRFIVLQKYRITGG